MSKLVVLESQDIHWEQDKCTENQYKFLRDLMERNKHSDTWLNHLAFNGRNRLTKKSASKLIDILLKKEEFELRELRD